MGENKELTQKEMVKLIQEIHNRIEDGLGDIIVLNAAFDEGLQDPDDLFHAEISIRDMIATVYEAMKESHKLTHKVEW